MHFIIKKKKRGAVEYVFCLTLIFMVIVFMLFSVKTKLIKSTSNFVEDGLVISNLASALYDKDYYLSNLDIAITDYQKCYDTFKDKLIDNLSLREDMFPKNNTVIKSKVTIHDFIIYNVIGNEVYQVSINNDVFSTPTYVGLKSEVSTPNGVLVENTSIYSNIGFEIEGMFTETHYVFKENCIDIYKEQQ